MGLSATTHRGETHLAALRATQAPSPHNSLADSSLHVSRLPTFSEVCPTACLEGPSLLALAGSGGPASYLATLTGSSFGRSSSSHPRSPLRPLQASGTPLRPLQATSFPSLFSHLLSTPYHAFVRSCFELPAMTISGKNSKVLASLTLAPFSW